MHLECAPARDSASLLLRIAARTCLGYLGKSDNSTVMAPMCDFVGCIQRCLNHMHAPARTRLQNNFYIFYDAFSVACPPPPCEEASTPRSSLGQAGREGNDFASVLFKASKLFDPAGSGGLESVDN